MRSRTGAWHLTDEPMDQPSNELDILHQQSNFMYKEKNTSSSTRFHSFQLTSPRFLETKSYLHTFAIEAQRIVNHSFVISVCFIVCFSYFSMLSLLNSNAASGSHKLIFIRNRVIDRISSNVSNKYCERVSFHSREKEKPLFINRLLCI